MKPKTDPGARYRAWAEELARLSRAAADSREWAGRLLTACEAGGLPPPVRVSLSGCGLHLVWRPGAAACAVSAGPDGLRTWCADETGTPRGLDEAVEWVRGRAAEPGKKP